MEAESASPLSIFEAELERLGGKCHRASSLEEIANTISQIATLNNCSNLVTQNLSFDGGDQIKALLTNQGHRVLKLEETAVPVLELDKADLTVTEVDMLIASTGTLVIVSRSDEQRLVSCLPRVHVGIVSEKNIVGTPPDTSTYLRNLLQTVGTVSFISGPSRTGDIEMKLILGVHGPHQVHAIVFKG